MSNNPTWVAVERCELCDRTRKTFSCRNCIKAGNFYSSKNQEVRYSCKRKRLRVVSDVNTEYHKRLESRLKEDEAYRHKKGELLLLKSRIDSLKKVIEETKERNAEGRVHNEVLLNELSEKKQDYKGLKVKKEELKEGKNKLHQKRFRKEQDGEKLHHRKSQLKRLQVMHVHALMCYIFPISKRKLYPEFGTPPRPASNSPQGEESDVVSEVISAAELELEEATRIIHVDGQWVSQDIKQMEHTIVDVGMPASGDFIKYYQWLKSYRNEPKKHESQQSLHSNSILSIPASLVYTAQLTNGLAFFLGVNLPYRVEYYDFSIFKVSRKKLFDTVNTLSANVMQLCFSQRVPFSELKPDEMLRNLETLASSSSSNLGWWGWFNTEEYTLCECTFEADSSTSDDYDSDGYDPVSADQEEWDKLLDLPSDHSQLQSLPPLSSLERERSLSASATDLMSSAAASVASLWSWK